MIDPEVLEFAKKEYENLWKEYGLETEAIAVPKSKKGKPPVKLKPKKAEAQPSIKRLEDIRQWLGECRRCGLCDQRNKIVFGDGNPEARLMFVGEGPGADEDAQGLPFVGRAGQLLSKIIEAMGYKRSDVYIANIVKCRPPGNRVPAPEEVAQCSPFLKSQIELIKPQLIVALGATATNTLLQTVQPMGTLRSKFHALPWFPDIQVMPTYHPAYLLRNPPAKKLVWDDMKLVMAKLK